MSSYSQISCFDHGYKNDVNVVYSDVRNNMAILADAQYIADIHKELKEGLGWKIPELRAVAQFAWGITLRQLSQYPFAAGKLLLCLTDSEHCCYV